MRVALPRLLLVLALFPVSATAADGPCASPRQAAETFLENLQPDNHRPKEAIRCFEAPDDMGEATLVRRVRRLKAVLDHRGLFVMLEDLSAENDHQDAAGKHRSALVDDLDAIELRRMDGEWKFTAASVKRVPQLYEETFSGWVEGALKTLPPVFHEQILGFELWQPIGLGLLLLFAWLVALLVRVLVRGRLGALLRRWDINASDKVLRRIGRPLGVLAALAVVALGLPELRLPIGTSRVLAIALRTLAALAGVLLAYRLVDLVALRLEAAAARTETKMDDQLIMLVRKTLRVLVVAVAIVFVLQNLNIDVTSLLAGLGIGGLALALAAKDTAANLFGSLTIMIDAPFYVGDWIKAAGVEGTVTEIGLRSTRVRTFYNSEISVPNSVLANSNIDNMSRRQYRRYFTKLSLGYDSTPEQVVAFVEGVRAIIAGHPDTRKDYYEVFFTDYGDSWLEVMLYVFFTVDSWTAELEARQDLLLEVKRLADELGVEFAFPTRTLHIESHAEQHGRPDRDVPDAEALAAAVLGFGPGGARATPKGHHLTHGFFAGSDTARGADDGGEG